MMMREESKKKNYVIWYKKNIGIVRTRVGGEERNICIRMLPVLYFVK